MKERKNGEDVSREHGEEEGRMERRPFLKYLGYILAYLAGKGVTQTRKDTEETGRLMRDLNRKRIALADASGLTKTRAEILREVLSVSAKQYFIPGDKHIDWCESDGSRGKRLPHDEEAIVAVAAVLGFDWELHEMDDIAVKYSEPHESIINTGSPMSSSFARWYLPHCKEEDVTGQRVEDERSFIPYHFMRGVDEKNVKVVSGMDQGIAQKRNHGILHWREQDTEVWRPEDAVRKDGWLHRDFLLVSRLPRNASGGEILLVSGGHGPGTQAVELMLNENALPFAELEYLYDRIGGARFYQFVLEVDSIVHGEPMSLATRARVSKELPPKEVRFSAAQLPGDYFEKV